MSSTYAIYCLSHDPAIEAAEDVPSVGEAIAWATDGFGAHPTCDLLVARFSGGLIELGCPGMSTGDAARGSPAHGGWHSNTIWAEAGLLRVAAAVIETEEDGHANVLSASLKKLPMCWTIKRLHRLRGVLGVAL